jgi:tripartite-type tricarboxylate transporter receptor subunit TctC
MSRIAVSRRSLIALGGRIDFAVVPVPVLPGHLKSGALKAIGTTTSARATSMPDLPAIAEQGMPDYSVGGWFAAVGPAKLPAAEVKRIHAALVAALAKKIGLTAQ